ncbi:splicing factor u2af-associated protein [Anaeramoeba flamelloides]|uniref:Splicing factor u2af-associated protein n=1 Tax=Anaeramoeba flamelloides TaxID=1746091 RepID=A0AAV7YXL6_9EUKA|nr:splicing factor u2af-associated protein [Anaeramoeba flamelloides]
MSKKFSGFQLTNTKRKHRIKSYSKPIIPPIIRKTIDPPINKAKLDEKTRIKKKRSSDKRSNLNHKVSKYKPEQQYLGPQMNKHKLEELKKRKIQKDPFTIPEINKKIQNKSVAILISGLPEDISQQDLSEHFSTYGIIRKDPITEEEMIEIFEEENENENENEKKENEKEDKKEEEKNNEKEKSNTPNLMFKNPFNKPKRIESKNPIKPKKTKSAVLEYFVPQSVNLAITCLNETEIRAGYKITIKKIAISKEKLAQINKETKMKKKKVKNYYDQSKELSWNYLLGEQKKKITKKQKVQLRFKKTVVLKNMYIPNEISNYDQVHDLQLEIRKKAETYGKVNKVIIASKHIDGVILVRFSELHSSKKFQKEINGKYFDKRLVTASLWDGTRYDSQEDIKEEEKRTKDFGALKESQ